MWIAMNESFGQQAESTLELELLKKQNHIESLNKENEVYI